ncbi:fumarylacetoacetase [Sphingomonas immobilis]|uniref:fumarylacetoacetase n=1 Tax=Sphingomonas immobilis TaxID=3063997 RepID=A0ABT8ZT95_9SPHN|nr:fumarylacetoacetase [Sphingomonas sp. CA1-15]MDO7840780.1 fumarylacetoacetase [Sphingomonas sp. CA1-15]
MTFLIDETHDAALRSWIESANGHLDFPIQNLPLGIFSSPDGRPRPGVAIGDFILDLQKIANLLPAVAARTLDGSTLNALFALPATERRALRHVLSRLLSRTEYSATIEPALLATVDCVMHPPAAIGDYTDFYVGIHHATNIGKQFRPDNPLLPNYKHIPIGYHGRASSIRVSGIDVVRPKGQRKSADEESPSYGPSRRLDYELELGVWIGRGNLLGEPISIAEAPEHIVGLCLLNDWSARDLQAWEYQPLGPFLAKNFHTTVSPWVITAEALAPYRIAQPRRAPGDPDPLPYLLDSEDQARGALAIDLEVSLTTAHMRASGLDPHRLSTGSASNMYWTIAQMVTHHSSNGCDLQPGDLLGTGTISAPDPGGYGSLMELSRGGAMPIALPGDETRTFLEDGDEIILTARAMAPGRVALGFGHAKARILPSRAS